MMNWSEIFLEVFAFSGLILAASLALLSGGFIYMGIKSLLKTQGF